MSPRLPRVTAEQVVRVVKKLGFRLGRQSGSHQIYKNEEGKRITVPRHGATVLHPKVLKSILNDAGISENELRAQIKHR